MTSLTGAGALMASTERKNVRDPRTGRVHQRTRVDRRAGAPCPRADRAATSPPRAVPIRSGCACGLRPPRRCIARIQDHQSRIIDPAIGIRANARGVTRLQRRPRRIRRANRARRVSGSVRRPPRWSYRNRPSRIGPGGPRIGSMRQHEPQRLDHVPCDAQQHLPLGKRLHGRAGTRSARGSAARRGSAWSLRTTSRAADRDARPATRRSRVPPHHAQCRSRRCLRR